MKKNTIIRIILTCAIVLAYSFSWMILEFLIEGSISNSNVDNIIMVLFIPIIYLATGQIIKINKLKS